MIAIFLAVFVVSLVIAWRRVLGGGRARPGAHGEWQNSDYPNPASLSADSTTHPQGPADAASGGHTHHQHHHHHDSSSCGGGHGHHSGGDCGGGHGGGH